MTSLEMAQALHISYKDQQLVLGFPHTVKESVTCQSNTAYDGEDGQTPVDTLPFPFNDTLEEWTWLLGILIRQAVKSITLSLRITTAGKTGIVATYLNLLIRLKLTEQDLSKRFLWSCQSSPGSPSFGLLSC